MAGIGKIRPAKESGSLMPGSALIRQHQRHQGKWEIKKYLRVVSLKVFWKLNCMCDLSALLYLTMTTRRHWLSLLGCHSQSEVSTSQGPSLKKGIKSRVFVKTLQFSADYRGSNIKNRKSSLCWQIKHPQTRLHSGSMAGRNLGQPRCLPGKNTV